MTTKMKRNGLAQLLNLSFVIVIAVLWKLINCTEVPMTSNFLSLVTHTSIQATGGCSEPEESDINLLLYTRNNPNTSIHLNAKNPIQINTNKKIIVLIHGWTGTETRYSFPQLKDAYLKRYDSNVIMVDWSKIAWYYYTNSVCYLPKIGKIVANFLCLLNRRSKINLNTIHLVGHSLGAQMSGFIGQHTINLCRQKIGRITGLDPAGPLYQELPITERLDKTDALFVDVMHTNEGVLGYVGDCGDVDFYVNCGTIQPGCREFESDRVVDQPASVIACDHLRTVEYMAESINSHNFKARACKDCPKACNPDFSNSSEIIMGEDCPRNSSGPYVLATNSQSPFALGTQ